MHEFPAAFDEQTQDQQQGIPEDRSFESESTVDSQENAQSKS